MADFFTVSELLDLYKPLLSKKIVSKLEDHFDYDLSFVEIAENEGISRAGTFDAIKTGMNKLLEFEELLHLLEKQKAIQKIIDSTRLPSTTKEDMKVALNEIERINQNGI